MKLSKRTVLGIGLAASVFLCGLWAETHKAVKICGSIVQVADQSSAQSDSTDQDQDSTGNQSDEINETKDDLTENDIKAAAICINHHPVKFDSYSTAIGGTVIKPTVPGEDNLHCWTITLGEILLGDVNGDGKGDAVAVVTVNAPFQQEMHVVAFINQDGTPVQVDDLMVSSVYNADDLKIESGKVSIDFASEEKPNRILCHFRLSNNKLVQISPYPQLGNGQSITRLPLTKDPHDVLLAEEPERYADMISRGTVIRTGVHADRLTKNNIQRAIFSERKRLNIDDPWSGCGTIQQIAYGDFTGDNRQDAAAIVTTGRADHDQLDLIPLVIEHGRITLYGVVPLGGGGYDTWEEKLRISSGKIKVRIKVGMKFQPPPPQPWIAWNFEIRSGKLLKMF